MNKLKNRKKYEIHEEKGYENWNYISFLEEGDFWLFSPRCFRVLLLLKIPQIYFNHDERSLRKFKALIFGNYDFHVEKVWMLKKNF